MPTKEKPDPALLATPLAMDRINPGRWFLVKYTDGSKCWIECMAKLTMQNPTTKAQMIQLRGVGHDEEGPFREEFTQSRDFVLSTLTAAQAKRCGLGAS
jgi:hypothetical protein